MKKEIVTFATMAIGILATCAVAQQTTDSTSPASSGTRNLEELLGHSARFMTELCRLL
jgi:hypothetical protein